MRPFDWLAGSAAALASGLLVTLALSALACMLGVGVSVLGASLARGRSRLGRAAAALYVEVIRNTPFLLQLFFIFFVLPRAGLLLNPFATALAAMTINLGAYGTAIVAAGIDAVPPGQAEAGAALGLRPRTIFTRIVLPQALRVIYPALTSQAVIMMLESSVVSQIAVPELTHQGDLLQSRSFRTFETFLVVTAIYLAVSVLLRRAFAYAGRGLARGGAA